MILCFQDSHKVIDHKGYSSPQASSVYILNHHKLTTLASRSCLHIPIYIQICIYIYISPIWPIKDTHPYVPHVSPASPGARDCRRQQSRGLRWQPRLDVSHGGVAGDRLILGKKWGKRAVFWRLFLEVDFVWFLHFGEKVWWFGASEKSFAGFLEIPGSGTSRARWFQYNDRPSPRYLPRLNQLPMFLKGLRKQLYIWDPNDGFFKPILHGHSPLQAGVLGVWSNGKMQMPFGTP